jgi:small subunit ribosomal protein S2
MADSKTAKTKEPVKQEVKKEKGTDYRIELSKLLEAGVHFGHLARRWHPKMSKFIWQRRGDVHIFDLLKTNDNLQKSCEAIKKLAAEGKSILFVGTKRQASPIIKEEAKRAGVFYIENRWPGGLISNWEQIKKSIRRYQELEEGLTKGKFNNYTKKERILLDREMTRLKRLFGGVINMNGNPDIIFVIDPNREKSAIKEARSNGILVFAVADTNCDPDMVDYIVPANDDAVRSIKLLVEKFANAVIEGKEEFKKKNKVEVKNTK